MAECRQCGAYTKFNNGLCTRCYSSKNFNDVEVLESDFEASGWDESQGLSERDRNYRYNVIKGRIAETLIHELFQSLGYKVFRYGMENTIPGISELLKGVRSDVANDIKRMPDFVVQNPANKQVNFVEVKFRASGEFRFKDLPKNYPYTNAYIIVVSKKQIKCITYEELLRGEEITASSTNYLGSCKEFDLDKDVILDFCKFAVRFF